MKQNNHNSQKVGIAHVLIIILWQSTLPQHDDRHGLQECTINIYEY